jgi:hypothetical protein
MQDAQAAWPASDMKQVMSETTPSLRISRLSPENPPNSLLITSGIGKPLFLLYDWKLGARVILGIKSNLLKLIAISLVAPALVQASDFNTDVQRLKVINSKYNAQAEAAGREYEKGLLDFLHGKPYPAAARSKFNSLNLDWFKERTSFQQARFQDANDAEKGIEKKPLAGNTGSSKESGSRGVASEPSYYDSQGRTIDGSNIPKEMTFSAPGTQPQPAKPAFQ